MLFDLLIKELCLLKLSVSKNKLQLLIWDKYGFLKSSAASESIQKEVSAGD